LKAASDFRAHALRLAPGADLRGSLEQLVQREGWRAACVVSAVGSLAMAHLRLAGAPAGTRFPGPFEILSLSGTLGSGGVHLHLCLADGGGRVLGGHLLHGCPIHTTAELVLGELVGLEFERRPDGTTGYSELVVGALKP
jgi:uncharacterized protein